MAMVNMNNLLNGKDSRWLQLEVCREFQRNKCTRPDTECKFAHPPANVEVQNGRVTACYDSIKGRCNREKPPCKYFHPPQHLKDQLLINGRNHLALKNALMQQMGLTPPGQPLIPGQVTVVDGKLQYATPLTLGQPLMATNPYLAGMPQVGSSFSPYFTPGPVMPAILGPDPSSVGSPLSVVPQTVVTQQKMPRSDRLEPVSVATVGGVEVGKKRARDPSDDILLMDMKSVGSFYYESFAFPGMMPYKRPAADKSGMPVYQPNTTTYQQLMQLQQPFVPVSCEYSSTPTATVTSASLSPNGSSGANSSADMSKAEEVDKVPTNSLITTPTPDPATTAKEVAQQNYAKAMKIAASGINPVVALNYTGVALNKQAMSVVTPHQVPRFAPPPAVSVPGLNIAPHLAYPQAQPGLVAYNRAPTPAIIPQYTFLRPQVLPSYTTLFPQPPTPIVNNGFLSQMVAQYSPLTTTNSNTNVISSVALQPYKKMKTT